MLLDIYECIFFMQRNKCRRTYTAFWIVDMLGEWNYGSGFVGRMKLWEWFCWENGINGSVFVGSGIMGRGNFVPGVLNLWHLVKPTNTSCP